MCRWSIYTWHIKCWRPCKVQGSHKARLRCGKASNCGSHIFVVATWEIGKRYKQQQSMARALLCSYYIDIGRYLANSTSFLFMSIYTHSNKTHIFCPTLCLPPTQLLHFASHVDAVLSRPTSGAAPSRPSGGSGTSPSPPTAGRTRPAYGRRRRRKRGGGEGMRRVGCLSSGDGVGYNYRQL